MGYLKKGDRLDPANNCPSIGGLKGRDCGALIPLIGPCQPTHLNIRKVWLLSFVSQPEIL
jgi:hypothetical protein